MDVAEWAESVEAGLDERLIVAELIGREEAG